MDDLSDTAIRRAMNQEFAEREYYLKDLLLKTLPYVETTLELGDAIDGPDAADLITEIKQAVRD